ncbi:hypothetical protein GGR51DRAFT_184491 [Nemania sp. FL0031]|nr:hypothetical protein GGR51DRAFT_184491 [Nemania sp. FL0031]
MAPLMGEAVTPNSCTAQLNPEIRVLRAYTATLPKRGSSTQPHSIQPLDPKWEFDRSWLSRTAALAIYTMRHDWRSHILIESLLPGGRGTPQLGKGDPEFNTGRASNGSVCATKYGEAGEMRALTQELQKGSRRVGGRCLLYHTPMILHFNSNQAIPKCPRGRFSREKCSLANSRASHGSKHGRQHIEMEETCGIMSEKEFHSYVFSDAGRIRLHVGR